jgi:hypothetical protein
MVGIIHSGGILRRTCEKLGVFANPVQRGNQQLICGKAKFYALISIIKL